MNAKSMVVCSRGKGETTEIICTHVEGKGQGKEVRG